MFVQLKDYPDYLVTDDGKVISLKQGKWREMKPFLDTYGYLKVQLRVSGSFKAHFVHRLIAQTFLPNPEGRPEVNHDNGIKTDNRVENLEWMTHQENIEHAWATGLADYAGEKCCSAKLSNARAAELLALKGTMPQREAAAMFGISRQQVNNIWNGKSRKHLSDTGPNFGGDSAPILV